MDEDWRVLVTFRNGSHGARVLEALRHRRLSDEVRARLGERIAVSSSGRHMFLYADTINTAKEARQVVSDVLAEHGLSADLSIARWHPLEQVWDDSPGGMQHDTAAEWTAKHEYDQHQERQRSVESGLPEWTVRAELPSHHDAVELAKRLTAEGDSVVRRWKYLLVGAACEDDANVLARKICEYAPADTSVETEKTPRNLVWVALSGAPPPGLSARVSSYRLM